MKPLRIAAASAAQEYSLGHSAPGLQITIDTTTSREEAQEPARIATHDEHGFAMRYGLRTLLILMSLSWLATGCGHSDSREAKVMNEEQSWPFDQAPNVAAITTRQVLDGMPILRVVHYEDDHSWAFTCGTTNDETDGRVISMKEAVNLDSTIKQVADLLPGWRAWRRAAGEQWQRERED